MCGGVIVYLFPLSPQGVKARRATSMRRGKGCAECSNKWDESSVPVRYALLLFTWSFPLLLSLILYYSCFPVSFILCHISVPRHLPVLISFLSCPQDLLLCLSPFTSLSLSLALSLSLSLALFLSLLLSFSLFLPSSLSFSFMPCSWHVAQNHINTLLRITHTRVQKAERVRIERAVKNKLYSDMSSH